MDPDNVQSIRTLAQRYTAAWCSQDASSVAACYEQNGSLRVNQAEPAVGHEAITQVACVFMTAFPDMQVLMDELSIEKESITYHWTLIGTNTGPGGTGQSVKISGFEKWQLGSTGLIRESLGNFDEAEYQRQLGSGS